MALQHCFYLVSMVFMLTVQLHCVMGNLDIQDVRLRWGGRIGPVDVQMNGSWYAVCAKNWDNDDSKAACRELGYSMGQKVDLNIGREGLPFLGWKFNCDGDDTILSKCGTDSVSCSDDHKAALAYCSAKYSTTTMLSLTTRTQQYKTTVVPATTKKTVAKLTMSSMKDAPNTGKNAKGTTTTGQKSKSQGSRTQKQSQQFPIVAVTAAAAVGTVLGILLVLAVLLCCYYRRRARNQEDSKMDKDTDQVGMGELAMGNVHDSENTTYHTIQDPAVISTAPPSEHDENYSTIPGLQSPPTGGRGDERAPAPPPNQSDIYYSVVQDNGTASATEKGGTPVTAKTTQEPEYAVVKKESKRKEDKSEESDKGTAAPGPEYAVVNKIHKKDPKIESQYGTVDNAIYESY